MLDTITIQMTQRGVVVLPKSLRDSYDLRPGDIFALVDPGGVFVLSPRPSEVDALAESLTQGLAENGETLGSMLKALRDERETGVQP